MVHRTYQLPWKQTVWVRSHLPQKQASILASKASCVGSNLVWGNDFLWFIATHAKGVAISKSKWSGSQWNRCFPSIVPLWARQYDEHRGTQIPLLEIEITRRWAARDPESCAFIYPQNCDKMYFLYWNSRYMTWKLAIGKVHRYGVRCRLFPNQIRALVDGLISIITNNFLGLYTHRFVSHILRILLYVRAVCTSPWLGIWVGSVIQLLVVNWFGIRLWRDSWNCVTVSVSMSGFPGRSPIWSCSDTRCSMKRYEPFSHWIPPFLDKEAKNCYHEQESISGSCRSLSRRVSLLWRQAGLNLCHWLSRQVWFPVHHRCYTTPVRCPEYGQEVGRE